MIGRSRPSSKMGEDRNAHQPNVFVSKRPLFLMTSILTMSIALLSWLLLLHSTARPYLLERSLLPNSFLFAVIDSQLPTFQNPNPSPSPANCLPDRATLKVFMYDLPTEFHFGLTEWRGRTDGVWPDIRSEVPDYAGGLNLQHSIEYWLTLDLLSSRFPDRPGPCSAVTVSDSREADVVFVPFFSSLSFNRHNKVNGGFQNVSTNDMLQLKLVNFLKEREEWKWSGGKDHVVMAHHPNSMLNARRMLWPAAFVLADFGRYPPTIANVEKDVIAPYMHLIKTFVNDTTTFDSRPTLLYFQGSIYRKDGGYIRQELFYLLKDEKDVHFSFGSIKGDGINKATEGMRSSKFCLNIAGDTPSSSRLFDAIASHCVPVIISDEIELPFEDVIDYSDFSIFVRTSDAIKEGFLVNLIRSIGKDQWTQMWSRMKEIEHHFEYQYPSKKDDAVQMIWQAMARKASAIRMKVHKTRRYSRFGAINEKQNLFMLPKQFEL